MLRDFQHFPEKAVLFSVQTQGISDGENDTSLLELGRLVKTMGLDVVATLTQRRPKPETATLDTRVKALQPESFPPVLVSDTVGFIKKLPHDLVASFQSTLDEALAASLLLFTVDASDPNFRSQLAVTQSVLQEIGGEKIPGLLILNKIDKLTTRELDALGREFPHGIFISAHSPGDVDLLRKKILEHFQEKMIETTRIIPYSKGQVLGQLRTRAGIIHESYDETGTSVTFKTFPETLNWLDNQMA